MQNEGSVYVVDRPNEEIRKQTGPGNDGIDGR